MARSFSLDEYAQERCDELHQLGGRVEELTLAEVAGELIMIATLRFGRDEQAILWITEVIQFDRGKPHRRKYAYQAGYRDEYLFRYDRDPYNHPRNPEHRHTPGNPKRRAVGRRTLHDVSEELWEQISERETVEYGD